VFDSNYLLFFIYYFLFIIYYLLFIIYYLLFIIYYLLFIIYYLLFSMLNIYTLIPTINQFILELLDSSIMDFLYGLRN
jgi:hypothetical protein